MIKRKYRKRQATEKKKKKGAQTTKDLGTRTSLPLLNYVQHGHVQLCFLGCSLILGFFELKATRMGFNDLMHPRNIYRNSPPDFKILAEKFDYFKKFTKESNSGHFTLNFKDPGALRALTCALLEHDFGLKLSIPLDRLIPTVPLRLNYILWIEDLLSCLPEVYRHATVRGFDIGKAESYFWAFRYSNCFKSINLQLIKSLSSLI